MPLWVGLLTLFVSLFATSFCAYIFIELRKRPEERELPSLLKEYSDELAETSKKQLREIEAEWENMYEKFSKLAGRMDRRKQLLEPAPPPQQAEELLTHADVLRRRHR